MNYKHFIPSILGVILVGIAVWFSISHRIAPLPASSTTSAATTIATTTTATRTATTTVMTRAATLQKTVIDIPVLTSGTVMDALVAYAQTGAITYTTEQYPSLGLMITSINGLKNDSSHYWFLYINDHSSSTGASTARVVPGDTVEWRYEKNY